MGIGKEGVRAPYSVEATSVEQVSFYSDALCTTAVVSDSIYFFKIFLGHAPRPPMERARCRLYMYPQW